MRDVDGFVTRFYAFGDLFNRVLSHCLVLEAPRWTGTCTSKLWETSVDHRDPHFMPVKPWVARRSDLPEPHKHAKNSGLFLLFMGLGP